MKKHETQVTSEGWKTSVSEKDVTESSKHPEESITRMSSTGHPVSLGRMK